MMTPREQFNRVDHDSNPSQTMTLTACPVGLERLYNLPTKDQLEAKVPRTKYRAVKPKVSNTSEPSTSADMPETDDTDGHQSETSGKYSCQSCRARKRGELDESGNDSEELLWDEGTD